MPVGEWRHVWNRRLRPYLLKDRLRSLYRAVAARTDSMRLGVVASVGIGYVSGANDFFHLRPSEAHKWSIPDISFPHRADQLSCQVFEGWRQGDDPMPALHSQVAGECCKVLFRSRPPCSRVKCRNRPWYTPMRVPDCFLTYMPGWHRISAKRGCVCSNALHAVRIRDRRRVDDVLARWRSPYVQLSCEIEGHALGGGMLKLEPREAARLCCRRRARRPTSHGGTRGGYIDDAVLNYRLAQRLQALCCVRRPDTKPAAYQAAP